MNIRISLIIFFFFSLLTYGQESSTFSRYGVGDINYGYSAKLLGIGDIGVTQLDPDHILTTNPASWSVLNRTRIEISLGYKGITVSNDSKSAFTSETQLRGLTIGVPLSMDNGMGLALGIIPYSKVSYVSDKNYPASGDIPEYKVIYKGEGGIARFFLGTSYSLPFQLKLGATLDYYFGNLKYYSNLEFNENSGNVNTSYENNHRLNGFGTTLGLISPNLVNALDISFLSDLKIGLSYNFIGTLNNDTLYNATSSNVLDTLAYGSVKTTIPSRINAGISFALSNEHNFILDLVFQPWSNYKLDNISSDYLRDALKFSFAYEFIPIRNAGMSSLELMVWRAGLSYEQTQYIFNAKGIDQYSVFGGFTYPLGVDNTLDLGIQYGIRGSQESNILKENFVKLYLGISFGELWFMRYEK
jgi:hypothetical protein